MRTVWDDTADEESRAALRPSADRLDRTPDVLVVGGGVVGLGVAAMCRRAGIDRVTLIERERLVAGPSRSAAGLLCAEFGALHAGAGFVEAARRSLDLHRELAAEWDTGCGPLDWLVLSERPLARLPPGVRGEVVPSDRLREVEPEAAVVADAMLLPGAAVHPFRLAGALARHAGRIVEGAEMTGFEEKGARVVLVHTTAGDVTPGTVVFATGSALPEWAAHRSSVTKGHLLSTAPAPFRVRHVLATTMLVFQTADRRLVAGGTLDVGDEEPGVRAETVEAVRAELGRLVPAAGALPIEREWACFRPGTPDGLPVVDRLPGLENAWMSVGHFRSGLLMSPGSGRAIAEWITTGERPAEVAPFALARFAAAGAPASP